MPATPAPRLTVDLAHARAFWYRQQGLEAPVGETPHELVSRTGWVRTLGGIDAYLALWSRRPGLRRAAVDEALASRRLAVAPAVRGCIYLVPFVRSGDEDALARVSTSLQGWRLLSFEDGYTTLHGGPGVLVDPAHHGHPVASWGSSKPSTLGEAKHLASRPILWGPAMVGFWEHDPDAGKIVTGLLGSAPRGHRKELADQARALGDFIVEDLGHGRSFSLDTDDELRARAASVRALAGEAKPAATKEQTKAKAPARSSKRA